MAIILVLASSVAGQTSGTKDVPVTVVAGESWLNHLQRSFDETSMGKTGRLGPPPLAPGEEPARWQTGLPGSAAAGTVSLHGADLYRLNCRGCHGEAGQGAPPEINSVINPVRASSVTAVMERMKAIGMSISRADATKLAEQAKTALLQRLHQGGQDMPAFSHLNEAEIRSLMAYLKQLAGVRGAEREQVAVRESPVRVGEQIVRSTCHICHSAAGPNPSPEQLQKGAIPPLNTLTARASRLEFVQKVTRGAPVLMGAPPLLCRGRMPVFYYLSEEEAADVYLYLTRYPPYQGATLDPAVAMLQQGQAGDGAEPPQTILSLAGAEQRTDGGSAASDMNMDSWLLPAGLFAALLMAAGLSFTMLEMRRLAARSAGRVLAGRRSVVVAGIAASIGGREAVLHVRRSGHSQGAAQEAS
ncbi:MAG: c-type cytochrome [Terriglobales bacterium]